MPETTGAPWNWRIPDSLGNDSFKTGWTAIRHLAADIAASLSAVAIEETIAFPALAANWAAGADGVRITKIGRVINLSCHLTRSSTNYVAGGIIFTMPANCIPRQMQWPPVRRFDAVLIEGKIRPTKTVAGADYPGLGGFSLGSDVPAGSGAVFSHTFLADA